MDAFRYYLALALVVAVPPWLLFWPVVHPFVGFFRRLGPTWTYALAAGAAALGMVGLFRMRALLLAGDLGTSWPLALAGALLVALAARWRIAIERALGTATFLGLPELDPRGRPGRLVVEGPYARLRHPRYAQFAAALLGWSLVANFVAVYALWALSLPFLYLAARLEERELRERFGAVYEDYARRVPRFRPRRAPHGRPGAEG